MKDIKNTIRGFLKKIRSFLPPSSRSFWLVHRDFSNKYDMLFSSVVSLKEDMYKTATKDDIYQLKCDIQNLNQITDAYAEHEKQHFYALMHDKYPEYSTSELKRKAFRLYPEAEGNIRLMQLANAKLMHELDEICRNNKLRYWVAYGSLIGVLARDGFIPWDDDVDICMLREDVDKLIKIVENNSKFQITVVYDWYVKVKQIRFCSRNENIPCFIDVSIYDWANTLDKEKDELFKKHRRDFMREAAEIDLENTYWKETPYLYKPGSGNVAQCFSVDRTKQDDEKAIEIIEKIEALLAKHRAQAISEGILNDSLEKESPIAVAYSLENIYDAPWRQTLWDLKVILPTERHKFEQYEVNVPKKYEEVANVCYPAWPYLPKDILGHDHFAKDLLEKENVKNALIDFVSDTFI